MKATNQFDYPSKASQSYKSYQQQDMIDTRQKTNYQKTKYKQHMQQVKQSQRLKVKEQQQKKKQQQKQQNKAKIRIQIQKKKKQLEELQKIRLQTEENQRRSYELALIKEQQDKIKKLQEERRVQENKENAEARFQMALKRLDQQKQSASYKERQAQQRRKAAEHMEKVQRQKAIKYKQYLQEKQRNSVPEQKITFQEYKQNLGRSTYNKNIDYTKTCLHNPKIIVEPLNQEQRQNAFEQGNKARQNIKQKSEQKRKTSLENHQKSLQRGKQALLRLQREKQYMQYEQQTSEQQKKYNLQRLEAGKKNQYTGVKPTTLEQMQNNKKQRSQEEFNKMFFQPQVVSSDRFNRGATKYEIVQTRMAPNKINQTEVSFKKTKNYLNKKEQSQIPCVSEGKYSFQEPEYSQFHKSHSRSQNQTGHINQQDNENEEESQNNYPQMNSNTKPEWRQTGTGFQKSTQQNIAKVRPIIKESYQKSSKNEQKQFDTEQMLRKYGIKRDSPQKNQANNRKTVGMSNICENRQRQKQQLSYSESQDSFM